MRIVLVEDELSLARVVKDSLEKWGYDVVHYDNGLTALDHDISSIDLLIADVMLPGMDGFTLVKKLRSKGLMAPILFLTARTATKDVVEGYESGGNDYLRKPFGLEELQLRVNELLRREAKSDEVIMPSGEGSEVKIGQYQFVSHKQTLQLGEQIIKLSHREMVLLQILSDHRNRVVERKMVLVQVWGDDNFFHARTMDVFITKLRKHLRSDRSVEILNIRGIGYKLIC